MNTELPVDIFEYKLNWKPGFTVAMHSDKVDEAKTWCRRNIKRHQWSMTSWTDVYEHTFHFENEQHSIQFSKIITG